MALPGLHRNPNGGEAGAAVHAHPEVYRQLAELHPIKRLGRPEEVAEAILWLCSDSAAFVVGHTLVADDVYLARWRDAATRLSGRAGRVSGVTSCPGWG